jgi:hypothetical protein
VRLFLLIVLLSTLQVCIQLNMCPPPSLFSTLHQALGLQANLLSSKFASFSIVTTSSSSGSNVPTVTGMAMISSSDDLVEEEDTASSSDAAYEHGKPVKIMAKAKVHGPGLALPMAS